MISGTLRPSAGLTSKEREAFESKNRIVLPFEQLTYYWLKSPMSLETLTFLSPDQSDKKSIFVVTKDRQDKNFGHYEFPADEARAVYGKWPEMPEQVYSFCDKPGVTPDTEWFEARNKKLKIKFDEKWDSYVLPVASLAPLALSYMTSSRGMVLVNLEMAEDNKYRVGYFYRVKCVFMALDDEDVCWEENLIILQPRLEKFLTSKGINLK